MNHTGEDIVLESGVVLASENIEGHLSKVYSDRNDSTAFLTIVLHHTNLPSHYSIDRLSRSHVEKGWPRLSYHFGILDDKIHIINDISKMTWHAKGTNRYGIGIVLLGEYQNKAPSKQTIQTLKVLISSIKSAYCIDKVVGHRDVRATLCPGDKAYECLINENIIE